MANVINTIGLIAKDKEKELIEGTLSTYWNPFITTIPSNAFANQSNLTTLNLPGVKANIPEPAGTTSIAFSGCSSLTSLAFPNAVIGLSYSDTTSTYKGILPLVAKTEFTNRKIPYASISNSLTIDLSKQNGVCYDILPIISLTADDLYFQQIGIFSSYYYAITGYVEYGTGTILSTIVSSAIGSFPRYISYYKIPKSNSSWDLYGLANYWDIGTNSASTISTTQGWTTLIQTLILNHPSYFLKLSSRYVDHIEEIDPDNVHTWQTGALGLVYSSYMSYFFPNLKNCILKNIDTLPANMFQSMSTLRSVELPNTTIIDQNAFKNCLSLNNIKALNVTNIGSSAFENCRNLSEIDFPNVIIINNNAFGSCQILRSLNLPNATTIGSSAFSNCFFSIINLPNATTINNAAFSYNTQLEKINLPNAVTIGNDVFHSCYYLSEINLPNVQNIGNSAFHYCNHLSEINLPNVQNIGDHAFYSCTSLTEINLPNVTYIGSSAFANCTALTEINLPNITSINQNTFRDCSALSSVSLPNVTNIRDMAFRSCAALEQIDLPKVTTISSYAFQSCTALMSVIIHTSDCRLYTSVFSGCLALTDIYVPIDYVETYKAASNWSVFASLIKAIPTGE